jgi:hypothetical protein
MDSSQYNIRASGGRYDLGGINHGAGYDLDTGLGKGSLYQLANGKSQSIGAWGNQLSSQPMSMDHAIAYKEMKAMLPNAIGANQVELQKQIQNLENMGVKDYLTDDTLAPIKQRVRFDPANPTMVGTWSQGEIARGWREENVMGTLGQFREMRSNERARTYERPDPNHM